MSVHEQQDFVYYDPRTDGEQLSLLGEQIAITDDAMIPDEVVSEGLTLASNATDGVRIFDADGNAQMDIEVYAPGTYSGMELWMCRETVFIELPFLDFSEATMRGAVRAVLVARALGKIKSLRASET